MELAGLLSGAATSTVCASAPTPATRLPPVGWLPCSPNTATWMGCVPAPTAATGLLQERLAELLAKHGNLDEAVQILQPQADSGV